MNSHLAQIHFLLCRKRLCYITVIHLFEFFCWRFEKIDGSLVLFRFEMILPGLGLKSRRTAETELVFAAADEVDMLPTLLIEELAT